ncbi:XRE family transcriptional regulator [Mesorhizobium sp. M0320]|uniref:helix-turn-helix domain-containing protein n=1 Tax=Mesorhizobium sp. M0320 TaxID=2956936 RepID=UPI003337877F
MAKTPTTGPYYNSAATKLIDKRIDALAGRKTQNDIAFEAGFTRHSFISMLKAGISKIPLDRVPALAKALEIDPARLFRLALEQHFKEGTAKTIAAIFGDILTENEVEWIQFIREVTGDEDQPLTNEAKAAIRKALAGIYTPRQKEVAHH